MSTQLTKEFFRALAFNMGATLHLRREYGGNAHHETEALFGAAARAISAAVAPTGGAMLSTKRNCSAEISRFRTRGYRRSCAADPDPVRNAWSRRTIPDFKTRGAHTARRRRKLSAAKGGRDIRMLIRAHGENRAGGYTLYRLREDGGSYLVPCFWHAELAERAGVLMCPQAP